MAIDWKALSEVLQEQKNAWKTMSVYTYAAQDALYSKVVAAMNTNASAAVPGTSSHGGFNMNSEISFDEYTVNPIYFENEYDHDLWQPEPMVAIELCSLCGDYFPVNHECK